MSIGLVRKIRARKGCASGIHIKFRKPASDDDVSECLTALANRDKPKASQERLTLSYATRHVWTGWMPWAGTYVETRQQGLLDWWIEKKLTLQAKYRKEGKRNDRIRISKKSAKALSAKATRSRSRKTSVKQRDKTLARKSKRNNKRSKARP